MFSLTAVSWAQGLAADVMILELSGNYGSITTANRPEQLYRSRAAPAQPGEEAAPPLGAGAGQRVSQRTQSCSWGYSKGHGLTVWAWVLALSQRGRLRDKAKSTNFGHIMSEVQMLPGSPGKPLPLTPIFSHHGRVGTVSFLSAVGLPVCM